jgi:hypothetical protein
VNCSRCFHTLNFVPTATRHLITSNYSIWFPVCNQRQAVSFNKGIACYWITPFKHLFVNSIKPSAICSKPDNAFLIVTHHYKQVGEVKSATWWLRCWQFTSMRTVSIGGALFISNFTRSYNIHKFCYNTVVTKPDTIQELKIGCTFNTFDRFKANNMQAFRIIITKNF